MGFVWGGLVSWSWEPPYLCLSDAQSLSQKAYLARWQRLNLSSIWFQFFRQPFLQPGSYVTFGSRWLRRLSETAQASCLMRTDSFILTVLVQSKYSDATHLGRHRGGGRMWPRTAIHITKDRKKSSEECRHSGSILFISLFVSLTPRGPPVTGSQTCSAWAFSLYLIPYKNMLRKPQR